MCFLIFPSCLFSIVAGEYCLLLCSDEYGQFDGWFLNNVNVDLPRLASLRRPLHSVIASRLSSLGVVFLGSWSDDLISEEML